MGDFEYAQGALIFNELKRKQYIEAYEKEPERKELIQYMRNNDPKAVEHLKKFHPETYLGLSKEFGFYPLEDSDALVIIKQIIANLPQKYNKNLRYLKKAQTVFEAEEGSKIPDDMATTTDLLLFNSRVPGYKTVIDWLIQHIMYSQSELADFVDGKNGRHIEELLQKLVVSE